MSKGRSQRGREVKKPKGGKKPVLAGSTFLRSQPAQPAPPTTKEGRK
jgi:hypothetical protein